MPDPTLSESPGPDPDAVPGYSYISVGPGRSHRPPFPLRLVPHVSCRDGTGMVQLVWL